MSRDALLTVLRVGPGASLQDRGRPGQMHLGVPPGGPWDLDNFAATLAAAGGPDDAALLELPLHGTTFAVHTDLTVVLNGTRLRLAAGARWTVPAAPWAVQYVAVSGGFDAPVVLGGRGLLPVAGLGGALGRFLRPGDTLYANDPDAARALPPDATAPCSPPPPPPVTEVAVWPVADETPPAAWAALRAGTYTVAALLDRTGTRLVGPALPVEARAGTRASMPVVRGAVQVTSDGGAIVLGPDHPTTGGYPVVAVLTRAGQRAFARLRPGHALRFVSATADAARPGG